MKTILWVIGIVVVTVVGVWIWLRWVNTPLNEVMSAPRASVESQLRYIKDKYTYRLVRVVSTRQPDVFSPWAIEESNRRTLVLVVAWLALVIFWTLFMFRDRTS